MVFRMQKLAGQSHPMTILAMTAAWVVLGMGPMQIVGCGSQGINKVWERIVLRLQAGRQIEPATGLTKLAGRTLLNAGCVTPVKLAMRKVHVSLNDQARVFEQALDVVN